MLKTLCASAFFLVVFCLAPFSSASAQGNSISLYLKASEFEEAGDFAKAAEVISEMLRSEKSAHLYSRFSELLVAAGEADKAMEALKEAEKYFPTDPYFKFFLGQLYEFHKGDTALAYKYYIEASKLSDSPEYLLAASRAMESAGDYAKALDIMNVLVNKYGMVSSYYSDRGRLNQRLGKEAEAIADLKKAVEIDGNMPAMLRLADIYLSSGDSENAKKLLQKITAAGDNMIIPELKLGEIYQNEKDYAKAIELFSSVADKLKGKDRAAVLKQLGYIQYETGDYDNASRTFEWVTELNPEDSGSAYFAGSIYEYLGKPSKAKEIYSKALKTHPSYAQLLKRMAVIYMLENKPGEALGYLEDIDPLERDVDYYLLLSECYSMEGNHNKAVLILMEGLEDNPTDTGILYAMASQYESLKEREKALDSIKKALALEPENPVFQNFLGYLYADMGINLEEAASLITKALEKDPANPAYLDSLGWVYFKKKNYKKAYEFIDKALKSAPGEKEIEEHMEAVRKELDKK